MEDLECSRSCLMKRDLRKSKDKLVFLKDNWPSFDQIGGIGSFSDKELRCLLCLLNTLIDALANDECWCSNKEIIRLVMIRTLVENTICLHQIQKEVEKLSQEYLPSNK